MQLNSYLIFDGNAREALTFYQSCLGGEIASMMSFGEMPGCDGMPAGAEDRLAHGCLVIDDHLLMASDTMPGEPYEGIKGSSVNIAVDTVDEARRLFEELSASGSVQMDLQETFWAHAFAMLNDRFGVPWMINCRKDPGGESTDNGGSAA
jgi:PhnB protein